MVSLVATAAYAYAGRSLQAGETFEASEKDADLLKLVKRAVDAPLPSRPTMHTRDLAPETAADTTDESPKPKRQYRRRDLTVEP